MTKSIIKSVWVKTDTILRKILCFAKYLLTNSDIYSFDSTRVLKQLFQHDHRFTIFFSLLISIKMNKISINQSKLKNLLQSLNLYTLSHQIKLSRIKKTFHLLNADLILARHATKVLFKANMTKKWHEKYLEQDDIYRYRSNEASTRLSHEM